MGVSPAYLSLAWICMHLVEHGVTWRGGDAQKGWGRGAWVWPKAQLYCLPYWLPLLLSPSFIFISSQLHQISNSLSCITNLIPPFFCGLHYAVADDSLAGVRVNSHENATPADGEAHKKYDKQSASVPSSARTRYKLLMRSRTVCVCVCVCVYETVRFAGITILMNACVCCTVCLVLNRQRNQSNTVSFVAIHGETRMTSEVCCLYVYHWFLTVCADMQHRRVMFSTNIALDSWWDLTHTL